MLEFLIFISIFLILRAAVHSIPKTARRKKLLELSQIKLMYQDDLEMGDKAIYYRELFGETERVVNQMCRDFKSVNVLFVPEKMRTGYAEMIFIDWMSSYLVVGIDVVERFRGDKLLKSLFAHELAHHENRDLHLLQAQILSYLYDGIYLAGCWFLYRNYQDIALVAVIFGAANLLMLFWKIVYRALLRRNEYKCDELSFRFYPTGCLPFLEQVLLIENGDGDDGGNEQQSRAPRLFGLLRQVNALFSSHPPVAARIERLRAKAARENINFETIRL